MKAKITLGLPGCVSRRHNGYRTRNVVKAQAKGREKERREGGGGKSEGSA